MRGVFFFLALTNICLADNVILMIGDGMGPNWVTLARMVQWAEKKKDLNLSSFEHTAFVKTLSADNWVTDSAAAATAYATGFKTNNGVLSMDPSAHPPERTPEGRQLLGQGGKPLETLAEIAKKRGYKVGLVTDTRITHATPAAFYAHHFNRSDEAEIARQLLEGSTVDLIMGGGRFTFESRKLMNTPQFNRYRYFYKADDLKPKADLKKPILGLFAADHLPYEEKEGAVTLSAMTTFALETLANSGSDFFLVVEGGRIDHAGHEGEPEKAVRQLLEFDEIVGKVKSYVSENQKIKDRTLILVVADHETGGMAINGYMSREKHPFQDDAYNKQNTKEKSVYPIITLSSGPKSPVERMRFPMAAHTALDAPAFAWGREASKVRGTLDNTEIFRIAKSVMERSRK